MGHNFLLLLNQALISIFGKLELMDFPVELSFHFSIKRADNKYGPSVDNYNRKKNQNLAL
jgi:hypothetical protein